MFSSAFDYYRASSIAEAHSLLAAHPGAKLIAGGHSLIPMMKLRLAAMPAVIDIGRVEELRGIAEAGTNIRIGALSTHAEIAASPLTRSKAPALADAAGVVGDPAVRNRGTIGGNIAHADPASDLPTVLVALDAQIVAASASGERAINATEFFTGVMSTALRDDEIISAVLVPASGNTASAYVKFSHPASRYAVVGVAAAVVTSGGKCSEARVALGGLVPHARRASSVEKALVGTAGDEAAVSQAVSQLAGDLGDDVTGDIFASAEYRRAVVPTYAKRAVLKAFARAGAV